MTKTSQEKSIVVRVILSVVFLLGIMYSLYLISEGQLTNRESALVGIMVTILSILSSWIITDISADSQYNQIIIGVKEEHRNNLRTYALKAAEKVNNLSNELNRLSIYLEDELNFTDYRTPEDELLAKEERIESAIHLTRTLKSFNDASLSDWEGIIGDELDQRREEKEEKEEQLKELIERVESVMEDQKQDAVGTQRYTQSVSREIESLKKEIRLATFQLNDTTIPKRIRKKDPKQEITARCPNCGFEISYLQRPSGKSYKTIICPSCSTKLISTFTDGTKFVLKKRELASAEIVCPKCSKKNSVYIDTFPTSCIKTSCPSCSHQFRVIRTVDGLEIREQKLLNNPDNTSRETSEIIMEQVRELLPPQPWPTGTHKIIADTLKVKPRAVSLAITELVNRKIINPQINGIVYVPKELTNTNSK